MKLGVIGDYYDDKTLKGQGYYSYRYEQENSNNVSSYSWQRICLSASIQSQIEVTSDEAIKALNTLNEMAGLRIALCANSSIWQGEISNYKAIRQMFHSWLWGSRSNQIGMAPKITRLSDYVEHILNFKPLLIYREPDYMTLDYTVPFRSLYVDGEALATLPNGETCKVSFVPEDIFTANASAWFDARLRSLHGTVEERVCCQQPPLEHLASPALTLGLAEELDQLTEIADSLPRDVWQAVSKQRCARGLVFEETDVDVRPFIIRMLEIAEEGLEKRNFGEEKYLEPLWRRVESGQSPVDRIIQVFNEHGIPGIIAYSDMKQFVQTGE